ncbi:acetyltransferase [Nocardioides sp. Soil797]|nr:acetyltransferase [Nocardioides sp. Soil797]
MTDLIPIAAAALVRDGAILLGHRHPERRWYPNCWDLVGGHIEPGERPEQAVVRECFEELGIHVHDPRPVPTTVSDPTLEMHVFIVTSWDGEPANTAPDEHDDLRWFRIDEVAELELADAAAMADVVARCRLND